MHTRGEGNFTFYLHYTSFSKQYTITPKHAVMLPPAVFGCKNWHLKHITAKGEEELRNKHTEGRNKTL
jgi:hypothetical protein